MNYLLIKFLIRFLFGRKFTFTWKAAMMLRTWGCSWREQMPEIRGARRVVGGGADAHRPSSRRGGFGLNPREVVLRASPQLEMLVAYGFQEVHYGVLFAGITRGARFTDSGLNFKVFLAL